MRKMKNKNITLHSRPEIDNVLELVEPFFVFISKRKGKYVLSTFNVNFIWAVGFKIVHNNVGTYNNNNNGNNKSSNDNRNKSTKPNSTIILFYVQNRYIFY